MVRKLLHASANVLERLTDKIWRQRTAETHIIDPYFGYATRDAIILRGRVLTTQTDQTPVPNQSILRNFRQMTTLFLTDELADVEVTCNGVAARTDEEGYFNLILPQDRPPGWAHFEVATSNHTATCLALVPDPRADYIIISDIDDTVLRTGAYSIFRNLWTSLTGNSLTRRVFPDAINCLTQLSANGRNPIYFVSSSPWNLHGFLTEIFRRASLPSGPMFLRDFGISETQLITGPHEDHKRTSIDTLLNGIDCRDVILIGDTGQHDPTVYRDTIKRHPGRIKHVILRQAGKGPNAKTQEVIKEIAALGVPVLRGSSFSGFAETITAQRKTPPE